MSQVQSGKVFANGVTLHFVAAGEGVPLLLVHGWMGSSHHWRKVIPLLAARHRVVAVDMRGYGDSDKPYGGYDGRTLAEDLRQVCVALGLDRPIVVGHDMGALPALLMAAETPEAVRGLVYVDEPLPGYNLDRFTVFTADNPFVYWWFAFNAQPRLPALMWAGKEAELVDYFLTSMAADPAAISAGDKAEYVRGLRKPGGLDASFGWYREALTTGAQIREATATPMRTPVLAVNGQWGHPGVEEQMRLVATTVTGVTLAACGHLCAEEQPEAFAEAVLNFTRNL
ncbi:alpha/beta hydrolase [Brevundimonas sp.]|uniref:alpha/beta fold hydrolase n=1 Tax=Brevundimonas sp. TaxID=1871086 RepID=UPI002618AB21|nr:alpha/beta hydrolase [Brevundimonas sp.]